MSEQNKLESLAPENGAQAQKIDLVADENGAAAVNVSEGLPPLYKEIWYDSVEDELHLHKEEFHSSPPKDADVKGQNSDEMVAHRWSILMNKLTNIEQNTSSLSKDLNDLTTRVDGNAEQISKAINMGVKNEQQIAELNRRFNSAWAEMDQNMKARFSAMEAAMKEARNDDNEEFQARVAKETEAQVKEITRDLRDDITQEKYDSRKINLLILGLPESEKDDTEDLVNSFIKKRMAIPDVKVDIAYRLGKTDSHKPRPILAKFKEMAHRNKVWFSKSKISQKEGKAWIQEDLPKAVKNSYRIFFRILKKAKSLRGQFPNAHINGQSLFINGKAYEEGDLEQLPEVLRPSNLATVQSEVAVIFFGRFCPLSNHHPSPFTYEGMQFSCMEQYIAYKRAIHAGKDNLAARALKPTDPVVYKGILNELKANKTNDASKSQLDDQWYAQLDEVVRQGLRAKFQQNPALARFLCSTHPKALGEASPDKRWGIGFFLSDPNALDTEKWPAEGNVMGKQLSAIRNELLANNAVETI